MAREPSDVECFLQHNTTFARCAWVNSDPVYVQYHDTEWGVPVHEDRKLFEFLVLEGAQAGLSWLTILRRRDAYRRAFAAFDVEAVAGFNQAHIESLLQDSGIIRNRRKVEAAVSNARAFMAVRDEFGSFDCYIWRFVEGHNRNNGWTDISQIPVYTPEAEALSRDLRHRGFTFVGPTICYAHMQATGMVNDHTVDCFRYPQIAALP